MLSKVHLTIFLQKSYDFVTHWLRKYLGQSYAKLMNFPKIFLTLGRC